MSALPAISHHLFVAAIDEPVSRTEVRLDDTDIRAIEVEVLDWTVPVPGRAADASKRSSQSGEP